MTDNFHKFSPLFENGATLLELPLIEQELFERAAQRNPGPSGHRAQASYLFIRGKDLAALCRKEFFKKEVQLSGEIGNFLHKKIVTQLQF
ncbi:MAG: hypothetical protein V4487_00820 [Chlamydiota bacterium]